MRINNKKTQVLCISSATESKVEAVVRPTPDTKITSGDALKIVGFWFGPRPDVTLHVQKMVNKFPWRLWVLYHLRNAGVPPDDMLALYKSLLRPVLDFAVPAYHWLLTHTQSELLEKLQRSAFKVIYGWATSHQTVLTEKIRKLF